MKIKQIALGSQGLVVPVIGLGCMGMTGFEEGNMYGPADEQEAIATIHRSLELGGNFLDNLLPFLVEYYANNQTVYILCQAGGFSTLLVILKF